MKDQSKTKPYLLKEISQLQQRLKELEISQTEQLRALEELQRSEMKFRTLYDSTSDAVILMDRKIFDCNDAALKIFGCTTREELRGTHPADLSPPVQPCGTQSRALGDRHITLALKNGMHRFEWVHRRIDTGETFPAEILLNRMVIDGRMVLQAVIRDITQRKRMEEALRNEIEFNSTLIESSPAFFVAINADRTVRHINDAMLRALGYTLEELKNKDYMVLVPESDRESLSRIFSTLITKGQPTFNENRVLTKDGKSILVEWHGRAIKKPGGSPNYFFGVGTDITERKRVEGVLRESEEKFRLLIEQSIDPILLIHDNIFIDCNEAAVRLIQCSRKENLIGLNPADISPERQPDGCLSSEKSREVMKKAFRVGNNSFEWVHRTAGGEDFWVDVSLTVIPIHGKQILFTVWRDISKRKKVEQALLNAHKELEFRVRERTQALEEAYQKLLQETEQKNALEDELRQAHKMEAIGTLAGGIAHDFNNILASIIGFTEMAIDDVPDRPSVEKNLKNVMTSATRARELVKQILAFSRKTNHARALIAVTPIVVETVKLLRASIPATIHMSLSINATSDTVLATSAEVQGIVMNLATNALLAMEDRKGSLEIVVSDIELEPDPSAFDGVLRAYLQIMVRDTGVGIAPEVLKRIFDPFFTTREVGKGSGMGLAIVYGTVKSLNGMITVESEPARGSTFRVFLPKAKGKEKEEMIQVPIPHGDERVLFVDDEQLLVDWGRETLEKLGYTVTAVDDARQALDIFAADPSLFDVVLTDQAMPQMSGLELSIGILRIRADIPIILCTGYSETVSRDKSKEMGITKFLMKPLTRHELASTVRNVLDGDRD